MDALYVMNAIKKLTTTAINRDGSFEKFTGKKAVLDV